MDYLREAKNCLHWVEDNGEESPTSGQIVGQQAIAAALIALVERLDKIVGLDCDGKTGCLRVDDGGI